MLVRKGLVSAFHSALLWKQRATARAERFLSLLPPEAHAHHERTIPPPAWFRKHAHCKTTDEFHELRRRAAEDPDRFWGGIAEGFIWERKWDRVSNCSFSSEAGGPSIKWFEGGQLNITVNALDRHVAAGFGDRPAVTFEADDGASETYTFAQVLAHVCATARVLDANGVKRGDRVTLYMPMVPQLMFTMLACARMGAIHNVVFGGFSAEAVAERIVNCGSEVVVTADAGVRGGKIFPLKAVVDTAVTAAAARGVAVRCVLVHHRAGPSGPAGRAGWVDGRDFSLDDQVAEAFRHSTGTGDAAVTFAPAIMGAEDPLFILYTSGSTGKPKGVLHTTGGYMVYAATTFKYIFDARPSAAHYPHLEEAALNIHHAGALAAKHRGSGSSGSGAAAAYTPATPGAPAAMLSHSATDAASSASAGALLRSNSRSTLGPDLHFCTADAGWITGHSYITYGPLLTGTHSLMFEGVPTHPGPDRLWRVIDKHKATILYTAPTAIRALMVHGADPVRKHDLSSLRLLGSVGEPINAEAWRWYHDVVGSKQLPIIDTWWQTETGGVMISSVPGATAMKPGSATKPFFGIDARVVRPDGSECDPDEAGLLVVDKAWPGMMRTVFGDHERFRKTYFADMPGRYTTGDGAVRDRDGDITILGRVDDVVNVSGHRLSTAEVEAALAGCPGLAEAAVVGVPHAIKGEALYAFVTPRGGVEWTPALEKEAIAAVRRSIGAIATPDVLHPTPALPKTRSGKIMRRILRKVAAGETDLKAMGDTSTLAAPEVVAELVASRAQYAAGKLK